MIDTTIFEDVLIKQQVNQDSRIDSAPILQSSFF